MLFVYVFVSSYTAFYNTIENKLSDFWISLYCIHFATRTGYRIVFFLISVIVMSSIQVFPISYVS